MRHDKDTARRGSWESWQILSILVLLAAVAVIGVVASQQMLLDNARILGRNLVTSYAVDEDRNLGEYEDMAAMGMAYLKDFATAGASPQEVETWVMDFLEKGGVLLHSADMEAYAVVDGRLISGRPETEAHTTQDLFWYPQALEARGEVIFTDTYLCPVHHKMAITVAAADPASGAAIAFDLPMQHFQDYHSVQDLMKGGAYYVCDRKGDLIYYNDPSSGSEEALKEYVKDLSGRIERGELEGNDNSIAGMQGDQLGLYYQRAMNGWMCILTVPYDTLLHGMQGILVWYGGCIILFMLGAGGMWLRDRRLSRTAKRTYETVQVLGNMYYALYRIDTVSGTYEMSKGSDFVMRELSGKRRGSYDELVPAIAASLDRWTGEDFINTFSLEQIRKLTEDQVRDFGGEFLRQVGDKERWISVRMLADPVQMPDEVVLCFRDVEKEKEEQQRQVHLMKGALAAAEQSERSQKRFFSIMSHDMRTPLNIIIGMAGLALQPDCGREKMVDYLTKISTAGQQLLALINDLLEISRLEQGNVSMDVKPFDLCQELETCISPFQDQAQAQNKDFRLTIDAPGRMVKGDPARLGQIVNNLLSNAMKFTKEGDRISVSLRQMDRGKRNNYLFTVEDTGIGMSEAFLPKIFDPYARETRFGAKDMMGTGLGMPIVKNLVTRMGGQIAVTSVLGKGTCFKVTLPFDVGEAPSPLPAEEPPPMTDQLEGRKILLAEDNLLNMEIATELLQIQGAVVTPAENGREALEAFQSAQPFFFDAILMDMQMPEMDGCQAAQAIRALDRPDAAEVPIVALTANAFAEDINRTAQAGMNAHLAKPINIELLCSTLTKLISNRDPK